MDWGGGAAAVVAALKLGSGAVANEKAPERVSEGHCITSRVDCNSPSPLYEQFHKIRTLNLHLAKSLGSGAVIFDCRNHEQYLDWACLPSPLVLHCPMERYSEQQVGKEQGIPLFVGLIPATQS